MAFIAENELEKALLRAVQDRAAAPDFYRLLLESDLLVLGTIEGHEDASEKFTLEPGSQIKLVSGQKNGVPFLPVFSSLTRMQDYVKQESKFLRVNGRALLDLVRGAPVTLNPASEYGKELSPQEVKQLLDGPALSRNVADTAEYPMALVETLTQLFATRPEIATAWMIQATFTGGEKRPLLGIETTGDWSSLMQAIEEAAEAAVPGLMFDIQRVDPHNPVGLANALLQAPPFYLRRASGLTFN